MVIIDTNRDPIEKNPAYGKIAEEVGSLICHAVIIEHWRRQISIALMNRSFSYPAPVKMHGIKDLPYAYVTLADLHDYFDRFRPIITEELQRRLQKRDLHIGVNPLFCKLCLREIRNDLMQKGLLPASLPDTGAHVGSSQEHGRAEQALDHNQGDGKVEQLPDSCIRAYQSSQYAQAKDPALKNATDKAIYEWLCTDENKTVETHLYHGQKMPPFDTWTRYLRKARRHYHAQKNRPRAGRPYSSSIAPAEEIDYSSSQQSD